ncbi:hypothetical protein ACROYT_G013980 [Oculina patagonica]
MTYVLNNVLFNKEDDVNANPRGFQGIMRFIDDLGGRWVGPTEPFHKWVQWLNGCTKPKYGIEFTSRIGNEVEFLDILISFDHLGIRLRRIISNNDKLLVRLDELADAFIISGYNRGSVKRILNKIASKPRVLSYNMRNQENKNIVPWVITYGPGAKQTREFVLQGSKILDKSPIWRDLGAPVMICTRRASNLRDLLYKRKAISLSVPGLMREDYPTYQSLILSKKVRSKVYKSARQNTVTLRHARESYRTKMSSVRCPRKKVTV